MPTPSRTEDGEDKGLLLGVLQAVDRDSAQSQRRIAAELGIALGLVNAYLKRCINKGLVKISEAPKKRYAYYLTPQGFAEKSRLTVEYLSVSFSFFRRAKADCAVAFEMVRSRGGSSCVLAGVSDLAEIATICAVENGVTIVAIVDPRSGEQRYAGVPVVPSFEALGEDFDAVMVTDIGHAREVAVAAVRQFGAERVFVPALLDVRLDDNGEDGA
jgi:hypothetical protein